MTKLLIYRGDALHGEYELKGQTVRIGRNPQNDIVLEDPGKGVSRHHAEIRLEGGRYSLVDLDSQNGIWVHGSRVPSVRLEPGTIAAVGPFRLTVTEAPDVAVPVPMAAADAPTEYSARADAIAGPEPVDGAGHLLDGAPTPAASPVVAAPTIVPAAPQPPTLRPPAAAPAGQRSGTTSRMLPLAIAAVAIIALIGASGLGAYKWMHARAAKPMWDRNVAVALVNDGKCEEAMQQQIGPALSANPNDPDALGLKARCAAPPPAPPQPAPAPAPPEPPPTMTTAQKLDAIETALAANECQAALDAVNAVLTDAPDDERAKALAAKANACLAPPAAAPAAPRPAEVVAVRVAPAQGGLDVLPKESPRDYTKRVQAMHKRYDDAVALLQGQHYQQALREFDALTAIVPAGYLDLAQQRANARAAMRDEANRQYALGQQSEQHGDFNGAVQHYQRARDLDPTRDISGDVARMNDQKVRLGRQACTNGDANYALAHNAEAATEYERVLVLLPDTDPCFKKAKDRLASIRR